MRNDMATVMAGVKCSGHGAHAGVGACIAVSFRDKRAECSTFNSR